MLSVTVIRKSVNTLRCLTLYTFDRYPIAGNGENGFAFGLGMIKSEQIDEAIKSLALIIRQASQMTHT